MHLKTIVKRQMCVSRAHTHETHTHTHTQSCSCDSGECAWNYSRYLSRALWGNSCSASVRENLTWVSLSHTSTGKSNSHELYTERQHFWRLQVKHFTQCRSQCAHELKLRNWGTLKDHQNSVVQDHGMICEIFSCFEKDALFK